MRKITKRQEEALQYIQSYTKLNGYPPTNRDMCSHFGFKSTNAAADLIKALELKGYIVRIPNTSRTITVTNRGRRHLGAIK